MKLELYHIECALKPQFVWCRNSTGGRGDEESRFATNEDWNLKSRTVGMSVFIGVASMFGFTLTDIAEYMDIQPYQVEEQWQRFQERMAIQRDRTALEIDAPAEEDLVLLAYKKTRLTLSAVRRSYVDKGWIDPKTYINL